MTAIKNGTLLVKDSNGNTARVATLSQTDITTLKPALTDIGANSVSIQSLTNQVKTIQGRYVDVDTQQNITGLKVFNRPANGIICKEERMDVNVVPTSEIHNSIRWQDKNAHDVGMVKLTHETGNWHRMEMTAIAQDSSGNDIYGQLAVSIKPDGSIRTSCPQPPVNSNDTSIATTAWVNVKVKGLTGTDLSNYVDLSSTQTITGTKTFNDLKTVTPSASDNSTKVATTEWVKTKVDAVSEANKTETVASFSADMTVNDDSATYSILTSASTITVANGTDAKGWSKCVKIENAGATISLGSSWSWKDGSQPTLTAPCLLCLVWIGNLGVAGIISTTAA